VDKETKINEFLNTLFEPFEAIENGGLNNHDNFHS